MNGFRLKHPEPKEADVLKTVLRFLEMHPAVAKVWRQNTGAGNLVRRGGHSQWIKFGFAGCPDIHGFTTKGKAIYCEVKRPSGVVKPEQAQFLEQARQAGCIAFVARGIDDVLEALREA